jgi:hypothetical protein
MLDVARYEDAVQPADALIINDAVHGEEDVLIHLSPAHGGHMCHFLIVYNYVFRRCICNVCVCATHTRACTHIHTHLSLREKPSGQFLSLIVMSY